MPAAGGHVLNKSSTDKVLALLIGTRASPVCRFKMRCLPTFAQGASTHQHRAQKFAQATEQAHQIPFVAHMPGARQAVLLFTLRADNANNFPSSSSRTCRAPCRTTGPCQKASTGLHRYRVLRLVSLSVRKNTQEADHKSLSPPVSFHALFTALMHCMQLAPELEGISSAQLRHIISTAKRLGYAVIHIFAQPFCLT